MDSGNEKHLNSVDLTSKTCGENELSILNSNKKIIEDLNALSVNISKNMINSHRTVIEDLNDIKYELMHQKKVIDCIVDKCLFDDDLELIKSYLRPAFNCCDELHGVINRIADVFYHTWIKDCDYDDLFLRFIDNKDDDGGKYISLMTLLIADLFNNNGGESYYDVIKLCISEGIKGNVESSYSICKIIGVALFEKSYSSFDAASDILHKIKKHNSIRLSKASSRPKSRYYDEVVSILKRTVKKHDNASINSLVDKVSNYYELSKRKPPARNTIRSWISDMGYKPQGRPTNKYQLIIDDEIT